MAKVFCISSQTVYGPVGNSAGVPALQASEHEVLQIPTILLSNHPGLGKPEGMATADSTITSMFHALQNLGAFDHLAGVMTGYFSSAPQVIAVAKQIKALKAEHEGLQVLVDPVIGDHGRLYVGKDVAETIRDQLLPLATITTPNLFELLWLAGGEDVKNAVATLGVKETIVTSIPENTSHLRTELHTSTVQSHRTEKRQGVPNGTGDFLAGCYLAERLRHPATEAFELAMTRLEQAIARSIGSPALKLS